MGSISLYKLLRERGLLFSVIRNDLILFYSLFAILIVLHLLILVKLDGKMMEGSATIVN